MKRLLLSLICCSPLLFTPSISTSIELTGPSDETTISTEQYGPVSPVETLWAISTKLRPDTSVSVQQTMVALYKLNPYAFFKGNINKIIPESMLTIPSLEFVEQQTDREAIALINKYKVIKNQKTAAQTKAVKPVSVAKEEPVKEEAVETKAEENNTVKVDPAIVAENELNKQKIIENEKQIKELQDEMQLLNEQYIVTTESAQALKLKMQPLTDEVNSLNEQLTAEAEIQTQLQALIEDYKAQLATIEPAPYSGEGLLNQILRWITSSLTNLLLVICTPILLLLTVFVLISRIRSKRLLAEQEQELAESTAILMEESGQFDALLTDDFQETEEEELDFTAPEEQASTEPENIDIDELEASILSAETEAVDLSADDELDVVDLTADDELDIVDLTEDEAPEEEAVADEDDPFGIGALTEDEELISSIDLEEPETSEDDPFGIGALTEDEELISSVDLEEVELDSVSESEQADLDLAAEWEAQVSAESESGKDDDAVALDETEPESDSLSATTSEENETTDMPESETLSNEELSELDDIESHTSEFEATSELTEDEVDITDDEKSEEDSEVLATLDLDEHAQDTDENAQEIANDIDSLLEEAGGLEEEPAELDLSELDSDADFDMASLDELLDESDDLSQSEEPPAEENDLEIEIQQDEETDLTNIDDLLSENEVSETALDSSEDVTSELSLEDNGLVTDDLVTDNLVSDSNEADDLEIPELDEIAESSPEISEAINEDIAENNEDTAENAEDTLEESNDELDISSLLDEALQEDQTIEAVDEHIEELDELTLAPVDEQLAEASEDDALPVNIFDEGAELESTESAEEDNDLLAKQLSDVAFNEDVPLPKVDSDKANDFIDIETLLENSDDSEKEEPYAELALDLGLDDFPDVVELQEAVDIDDDENGIGAQLDLARAYLEIDDKAGAKEILMSVVDKSNGKQRTEIDKLLSRLT